MFFRLRDTSAGAGGFMPPPVLLLLLLLPPAFVRLGVPVCFGDTAGLDAPSRRRCQPYAQGTSGRTPEIGGHTVGRGTDPVGVQPLPFCEDLVATLRGQPALRHAVQ